MSSGILRHALAPAFLWTSSDGTDFTVELASPAYGPTNVTVPTTYARMYLGKGSTTNTGNTEPLPDFLQVVQAAINTAIVADGRTFTLSLTAAGLVNIAISSGTFKLTNWTANPIAPLLGFTHAITGKSSEPGDYGPEYLATFVSATEGDWSPRSPAALAETNRGDSFGLLATTTKRSRSILFDFIPQDPTTAAARGDTQTPAHPDPSAWTTRTVPWSLDDVLRQCAAAQVAFTLEGCLQLFVAGTGSPLYAIGAVDPESIAAPAYERRDASWPAYRRLRLGFSARTDLAPQNRT